MIGRKGRNMEKEKVEVCLPDAEPDKVKTYQYENVVFKVSSYYSKQGQDTLKDILERSIKRDVKEQMKF